jgi:hypothetical protein
MNIKSATPIFSLQPRLPLFFSAAILAVFATAFASAQTENVIHKFGAPGDGKGSVGGLVADTQGSLYGGTSTGGISCPSNSGGCGVIFKLRPPSGAGAWTENILYEFTGLKDGGVPQGGLLLNPATGKFYGAAAFGGMSFDGVIYELAPGAPWTETVIHDFSGGDGIIPNGYLKLVKGRLVGSTANGGAHGAGVVYALNPPVAGGPWTIRVLHAFDSSVDGLSPSSAGVIADSAGALYGTTVNGGNRSEGTVWKLTPPAGAGPWSLTTLHGFTSGVDGGVPVAVVLGPNGSLYGTTATGGDPVCQCGTVFQLTPPTGGVGPWTLTTLYTFLGGTDGAVPDGLVLDNSGTIYGVARDGGFLCELGQSNGCGVVFTLTPPSSVGGAWTEDVLYSFHGNADGATDGTLPAGRPLLLNGKVYGTTDFGGGRKDSGIAYEIVP